MEILRYLTSYFILVIGCDIVLFTAYMVKLKKNTSLPTSVHRLD